MRIKIASIFLVLLMITGLVAPLMVVNEFSHSGELIPTTPTESMETRLRYLPRPSGT